MTWLGALMATITDASKTGEFCDLTLMAKNYKKICYEKLPGQNIFERCVFNTWVLRQVKSYRKVIFQTKYF